MAASEGLYGSDLGGNMLRACIGELIGTFFLVLAGTATAVTAILNAPIAGGAADSLAVALSFGLTLTALVYALGHVSGCHLNPAVTLSLGATGKFPVKYVPSYIASQIAGAGLASFSVLFAYGAPAVEKANLAATYPAPGVSTFQALFVEALITFLLVFVILSVATDSRVPKAAAGIAVGFALAGAILIGGAVTGAAVNPARALGPMLVAGKFTSWWVYVVGPIVGALAAGFIYAKFLAQAKEPSEAET